VPQRVARSVVPLTTALAVASGCLLSASAASAAQLTAGATGARAPAVTARPDLAREWWLTALGVPQAWDAVGGAGAGARPGKGVTVAVLSTGVDAGHPDLAGDVTTGPDYTQSGAGPGDLFWGQEGTAVASLIAGHGHGDAQGITGVAPGARILSLRVTLEYNDPRNANHSITSRLTSAIAAGIRYAVSHGASVIALPLDPGTLGLHVGGDRAAAGGSAAERAAVEAALADNVVLVAPAGDNALSTGSVNYPAAYPGVIAVGATGQNGRLESYSNRRSYVTLTAPGGGLTVAAPGGGYQMLTTTDMSAALAAGSVALIRARYPRLSAAQVTEAIEAGTTGQPAGTKGVAGAGMGALNAARALQKAASLAAPSSPSANSANSATGKPSAGRITSAALAGERSAAGSPGAGDTVTSVLRDAAICAGVLIVALAALLTLTRSRRRRRASAPQRELGRLSRPAPSLAAGYPSAGRFAPGRSVPGRPVPGHAAPSHAAPGHAAPSHAATTRTGTGGFPTVTGGFQAVTGGFQAVTGGFQAFGSHGAHAASNGRTHGQHRGPAASRALPAGTARSRSGPSQVARTGSLGQLGAPVSRPAPTEDTPPWSPAPMPAGDAPAVPAPTPPILPRPALATGVPPWEQESVPPAHVPPAHDSLVAEADGAIFHTDRRTSGPMYIWNPTMSTGPFPVVED
jgi:subtilisin family serine protease